MKRVKSLLLVSTQCFLTLSLIGCGKKTNTQAYKDDSEDIDISSAFNITCDFSKPSDPALIKKIDMYNAGCVKPIETYGRDMSLAKGLHPNSLRMDASIGKEGGNGGHYLVGDDCEIYDYNPEDDTFKIDPQSFEYDFSTLDKTLSYYRKMNVDPYISWSYIPAPLQDNGKCIRLDWNVLNWKECWEEIHYNYAKHYKDLGIRIGYNEIYNEPDLEILKLWGVLDPSTQGFLDIDSFAPDGDPSKGCYTDMYEYGVNGILRANKDATVGGPAFALGELGVQDWIGFFPRVKQKKLPLDFYSFHSYLDGDTWFLSDEARSLGSKNELEKVVDGLQSDPHFMKTSLHINEFSSLNNENGALSGDTCDFNYYYGAQMTLDGLFEAVDRSSIQLVNWAQLLSVANSKNDAYGLIDRFGKPKAAYNAIRIYQDMPVWRYTSTIDKDDSGLQTVVSSDNNKISILIWNQNKAKDSEDVFSTDGDRLATVSLKDAKFDKGLRRVYRIDKDHASNYDLTKTALIQEQNVKKVKTDSEYIWKGNVPAQGVVYITINKNENKDLRYDFSNKSFANLIKTQYYYEDRYRNLKGSREEYADYVNDISGSYSLFDKNQWKTYLGVGDCQGNENGKYLNQGHANCAVTCDNLPTKFHINLETDVRAKMLNQYSSLGMRIDFYDDNTESYTKSVFLHNGIYEEDVNPNEQDPVLKNLDPYPWGTKRLVDSDVKFNSNSWDINLASIAPSEWLNGSRRAIVSFDMRNTGANSRCAFVLTK